MTTPGSSEATPLIRPAARVILLDGQQRVLLFRAQINDEPAFWFTPGGGLKPGETYQDAARRELWEETGLQTFELGPCVWTRSHVFYWEPETVWYHQQERYYLAHTAGHTVTTENQEAIEASVMTAHRWWPLADLHTATERLVPADFATRLQTLLQHGPPPTPETVGI